MGSIVIDASGEYIKQAASVPAFNSITVAGWWKRASSTSATTRMVVSLYASDDSRNVSIATEGSSGENIFHWNNGISNFSPAATTTLIPNDAWYYVAMAHGAADLKFFIWNASGTLLCSATRTFAITGTPADITVGARGYYHDQFFPGKYAYWKVWNTQLSQSDLGTQMFEPTWIVGTSNKHSGFDDTTTDTSGNSRTWTHNNTSTDSDTPPVTLTQPLVLRTTY